MHNTQTKPDFHQEMIDWGRDIQRQTDSFLEEVEKGYASEAADYLRKFQEQNEKHLKLPLSEKQKTVLKEAYSTLCLIDGHMGTQTGTDGWEQ